MQAERKTQEIPSDLWGQLTSYTDHTAKIALEMAHMESDLLVPLPGRNPVQENAESTAKKAILPPE